MNTKHLFACVGASACAVGLSLGGLSTAHAGSNELEVENCKKPIVGAAGKDIVLEENIVCSAQDLARSAWAGKSTFITVGAGGSLDFNGHSITLLPTSKTITAVKLNGGADVDGAGCYGGNGSVVGFARAFHVKGAGNSVSDVAVIASKLKPIAVGNLLNDGALAPHALSAAAAVVLDNSNNNSLTNLSVTGSTSSVAADLVSAVLVWGDNATSPSVNNTLTNLTVVGNSLAAVQGTVYPPLPADGETPAAPFGQPAITDGTPDGNVFGQTLSTAVMIWGTAPGTSVGHTVNGAIVANNTITVQAESDVALAGAFSLEGTEAASVSGLIITGNSAKAVAYGPGLAGAGEAQAGMLSLTESSANELSGVVIGGTGAGEGNKAAGSRSAGGAVIAVGQGNQVFGLSVQNNEFRAGSFTGALFMFGEFQPESRTNQANFITGVGVSGNTFLGGVNAGVFLLGTKSNHLDSITVGANVFPAPPPYPYNTPEYFGQPPYFYTPSYDVFDFGEFGPNSAGCAPFPYAPIPSTNFWSNIVVTSPFAASPSCIIGF